MPNMRPPAPISPWWATETHLDRRGRLLMRNHIKAGFRDWFMGAGFVETEAAILAHSPGLDAHIGWFETLRHYPNGRHRQTYLHTSPEFALKKLLAAGEEKIFDFARAFRNGEADSPIHLSEFTLLEFYRARETWRKIADDVVSLLALAGTISGQHIWQYGTHQCDVSKAAVFISVPEAFSQFAGIDILASVGENGVGNPEILAKMAKEKGVKIFDPGDWSDIFSQILGQLVEPHLAKFDAPLVLYHYPAPEAALAQLVPEDTRLAERFEIFACGVELANGYGELTDAALQKARFEVALAKGQGPAIDYDFLDALVQMPSASGVAVGFDRIVMLATGARTLADIVWTPPAA